MELQVQPDVEFELDWERWDRGSGLAPRLPVRLGISPFMFTLLTACRDIEVFRDELLGSGAAGVVYKGRYREQDVAIKVRSLNIKVVLQGCSSEHLNNNIF